MPLQIPAKIENTAWVQPALRKLPTVVSLLLTVAIAHVLVQITWQLVPSPEIDNAPASVNTYSSPSSGDPQSFRKLAAAHLFGEATRDAPARPAEAPETRLNLVLRGVLATEPQQLASVIISQGQNGSEDIYGVGDRLPGNVIIEEIHAEHVILNRGGSLEKLRLLKDEEVGTISSGQDANAGLPASPGRALTQIRSEILRNPTSFADYAIPVIVKEHGKQIGYRLQPAQKGELLEQVGLQPSDVITEINGISLDQPQNGISALRKITTASSISLKVRRGGAIVPINVQLQ